MLPQGIPRPEWVNQLAEKGNTFLQHGRLQHIARTVKHAVTITQSVPGSYGFCGFFRKREYLLAQAFASPWSLDRVPNRHFANLNACFPPCFSIGTLSFSSGITEACTPFCTPASALGPTEISSDRFLHLYFHFPLHLPHTKYPWGPPPVYTLRAERLAFRNNYRCFV